MEQGEWGEMGKGEREWRERDQKDFPALKMKGSVQKPMCLKNVLFCLSDLAK